MLATMNQVFDIAASGLQAAAKRVDVSARNVVNVRSVGTPEGASGVTASVAAYRPVKVRQTSLAGGGVEVDTVPVNPPSTLGYEPSNPVADERGMVAVPNVDLAAEMVEQSLATVAYKASAKLLKTADEMTKTLLDITS